MIDELNIENRIEIDRSEAEKYEFIHESCVFSLLFFQPNINEFTVRLERIQLPIIELLPNQLKCNLQHCVRESTHFSPFFVLHERMTQKARSALNLKSPSFFQQFFSSRFVVQIRNWL